MYTKLVDGQCVIICLCLDDMLFFGTSHDIVHKPKNFLAFKFDLKDIGKAMVTLGVKAVWKCDNVIFSQE